MRFNILGGVLPIRPREALRDAFAGVTLASMNIPQVLGYTRIAGTPVVTGLYTVLLPLVAFAVFGSSRHLVVAANSATAAIFSGALSQMAPLGSDRYMALVGMLTLETAGVLLLARIFKAGFLADFLSRTVLVGFLTGVGLQVGVAMLGDMLGVAVTSRHTVVQLWEVARAAPLADGRVIGVSIFVAGTILLARRFAPRFPAPLVLVIGAIAASAWLDLAGRGFAIIGPVPGGLPSLKWPDVSWSDTLALTPVAASCFVMIIAQSAATARIYAVKHKERVDENADILAISAANAAAALSGAFVVNGSPTQTAMAEGAGARSQVAQFVFAAVVAVVLVFLTGPLQYLPRCVLAAIVFTIAVGMVDVQGLAAINRESRGEFLLASFTAVAVPTIGVEQGILLAIAASLVRHVRHSYRPFAMVLVPGAKETVGAFRSGPHDRSRAHRLPVRRRPLLRQRRPVRRPGARPRRRRAGAGPVVRRRLRRSLRPRLYRRPNGPRPHRRTEGGEGRPGAGARQRLPALGSGAARRRRGGRRRQDLRHPARGDRRRTRRRATRGRDEKFAHRLAVQPVTFTGPRGRWATSRPRRGPVLHGLERVPPAPLYAPPPGIFAPPHEVSSQRRYGR